MLGNQDAFLAKEIVEMMQETPYLPQARKRSLMCSGLVSSQESLIHDRDNEVMHPVVRLPSLVRQLSKAAYRPQRLLRR